MHSLDFAFAICVGAQSTQTYANLPVNVSEYTNSRALI